jgi:hypothetical protein
MADMRQYMPRCRTCGTLHAPCLLETAMDVCRGHRINHPAHKTGCYRTRGSVTPHNQQPMKEHDMTASMTMEATRPAKDDKAREERLLAAQAARIVSLQTQEKTIHEQVEQMKAQILARWPEGVYQAGELKVAVKAGAKTINPTAFRQAFPPEEHPGLYRLAPDAAKARKQLGEERLSGLMTSRKPTVVVS